MKPALSSRLLACSRFVSAGDRVADVGCDHGYLSIYLLKNQIASYVYASDLREKPLEKAKANALRYGIREHISFYLSDGLQNVPHDFDTLICAGMGADTIASILDRAPWLKDSRRKLVLQCQTRIPLLRQYLYEAGYSISRETLAQDGDFYYPVMEVNCTPGPKPKDGEFYISPALLRSGSPLLIPFYKHVKSGIQQTAESLKHAQQPDKLAYFQNILDELTQMEGIIYDNRR